MKPYLEELIGSGKDGPQRADICRALLRSETRPLIGTSSQAVSADVAKNCADVEIDTVSAVDQPEVPETSIVSGFEIGSAVIPEKSIDTIMAIGARLRSEPAAQVLLIGRADNNGTTVGNCRIGLRRATAVKIGLQLMSVPEDRIVVVTRGSLDTPAKAANPSRIDYRRVDIQVLDSSTAVKAILPKDCRGGRTTTLMRTPLPERQKASR